MPYFDEGQAAVSAANPDLVSLDEVRRHHVTTVLEHCHGNRTNAAKILHLDRKTLYRKLVRWGLASR
ncbi:MAG: helix-turn-helix domain-containing protein [Kofleriaceae bacterium]